MTARSDVYSGTKDRPDILCVGADRPDILCVGAALWDIIGRSSGAVARGADVPGTILRQPGGVAMNLALALAGGGMRPALLAVLGRDQAGQDLADHAQRHGVSTLHACRPDDLATDLYVAIEDAQGLVAAVADTRSLERAGMQILRPMSDGSLATEAAPWTGLMALDGNLPEPVLRTVATSPLFRAAALSVCAASPDKAHRLQALIGHPHATLYLNRNEAEHLCRARFDDALAAVSALRAMGAFRVLVTDGARDTAFADAQGLICRQPPPVAIARVTGAGDAAMAAHVLAEWRGADAHTALDQAMTAAAHHVAGAPSP